MDRWCSEGANCFALVRYVPAPLAAFLDGLRSEIAPGCLLRAHLTVLPPRPFEGNPGSAWQEIQEALQGLAPFSVELGKVEVFQRTQVVYLSVGAGMPELMHLHALLNHGQATFEEQYEYHPHITLAQELSEVGPAMELALRRWSEYNGSRRFTVDRLTLVQNQEKQGWQDLAECELRPPVLA